MENDSVEVVELKEYYVYLLMDKKEKNVFYVGKGKGERAYEHEKEALRNNENEKHKRINEINSQDDNKVEVVVVGRYDTEPEAFAVESTLIHWVYGKDNLTNIASGHGVGSIRDRGVYDELEGIDIPEKERSNDGSYTNEQLKDREKNQIIPFMEDMKKKISSETDYELSDIDDKQSRFTRMYIDIEDFRINIGTTNSSSKRIFFEVTHKNNDVEAIKDLCDKTVFEIKNNGQWCKLNLPSTSDFKMILETIERAGPQKPNNNAVKLRCNVIFMPLLPPRVA